MHQPTTGKTTDMIIDISDEYRERLTLAADLAEAARELYDPPRYEAGSHVRDRKLTKPIYWQGRQWAVTGYGIEYRDGNYPIEDSRIWEEEDGYGWVRHMAEKEWVDLPDFAEALRIARRRKAIKEAADDTAR
jgi:hypothetical protein